jgi:transcriptional regulator GlxA family with amidase domain
MWAVIIGGVARKGNLPAAGTNRVLSVIDARFSEPLSLAELAAADALSERSLNRYFARSGSCPVGRLVYQGRRVIVRTGASSRRTSR